MKEQSRGRNTIKNSKRMRKNFRKGVRKTPKSKVERCSRIYKENTPNYKNCMKKAMVGYYRNAKKVRKIDGLNTDEIRSRGKSESSKLNVINYSNPQSLLLKRINHILSQPVAPKASTSDEDEDQEANNRKELKKMKKSAKEAVHMAKRMREIKRDRALKECKDKKKYLGAKGYLKCIKTVE